MGRKHVNLVSVLESPLNFRWLCRNRVFSDTGSALLPPLLIATNLLQRIDSSAAVERFCLEVHANLDLTLVRLACQKLCSGCCRVIKLRDTVGHTYAWMGKLARTLCLTACMQFRWIRKNRGTA